MYEPTVSSRRRRRRLGRCSNYQCSRPRRRNWLNWRISLGTELDSHSRSLSGKGETCSKSGFLHVRGTLRRDNESPLSSSLRTWRGVAVNGERCKKSGGEEELQRKCRKMKHGRLLQKIIRGSNYTGGYQRLAKIGFLDSFFCDNNIRRQRVRVLSVRMSANVIIVCQLSGLVILSDFALVKWLVYGAKEFKFRIGVSQDFPSYSINSD